MSRGSIIGKIVAEIALQNYEDETPLADKVNYAIERGIPDDIRPWFLAQLSDKPLTGKQGLKLIGWIFKNTKRAEINLTNIKKLRQARREQIIDTVKENLPTQAVMAHITNEQLEVYKFSEEVTEHLIPYLAQTIKRDEATIKIGLQWSLHSKLITEDDMQWLLRYAKPVNEYVQLMLI